MKYIYIIIISFIPAITFAGSNLGGTETNEKGLGKIISILKDLFGQFYTFLLFAAGVVFAWSVFSFLFVSDDDEKKKKMKTLMLYSIGALVLMFSIGAIVSIVQNTFFDGNTSATPIPLVSEKKNNE